MNQRAVQLAARMYEIRDTVRVLLGDHFQEQLQPCVELIRDIAKSYGCSELEATQRLVANLTEQGPDTAHQRLRLVAAYVEMVEPSPVEIVVPVDGL